MRLCRIPSALRQGWEEPVWSLGEELVPQTVQWLRDSLRVRNKLSSSQHPRQGAKLGCQDSDTTHSVGQVGWDNVKIHSDDRVCGPEGSP